MCAVENTPFELGPTVKTVVLGSEVSLPELASTLRRLDDDDGARVVLLAGSWHCSSGLPIGEDDPVAALAALTLPVVAWVDGPCFDEALELLLAADLRFASSRSTFRMTHVPGGRLPVHGGTQRLARIVGRAQALRLLATGEEISAVEGARIGLLNSLAGEEEVRVTCRSVANAGPIAVRYAKEAIVSGADMHLRDGLRLEGDLSVLLQSTGDRAEGLLSFENKRRPRFDGR